MSSMQTQEHMRSAVPPLTFILLLACLMSGCVARLNDSYYLAAHDPKTDTTNYFKIQMDGCTFLSQAKFSVGFYDRDAVERLFGENAISREFMATRVSVFDPNTGKRLADVSKGLRAAEVAAKESRERKLQNVLATLSGLLSYYQIRLAQLPELGEQFKEAMKQAKQAQKEAEQALVVKKPPDANLAQVRLRKVQFLLDAIRIAADGDVLVRFFDGAGNEVDVSTKSLVVFVATDVSRFAEAIRQLAESEEATRDLVLTVMGPRILEARTFRTRVESSNQQESALADNLKKILSELEEKTDPKTEDVEKAAFDAASAVADDAGRFSSSEQIEGYVAGMEAIP